MSIGPFDRQLLLFGAEGQARIASTRVAIIGNGGTGSHIAQQLAFLGVEQFALLDGDHADESSSNRLIGCTRKDARNGEAKVDTTERMILDIAPEARVNKLKRSFICPEGYAAIREADYVFGCIDGDAARFILNEVCQVFRKPYLDVATDVDRDIAKNFGGRVLLSLDGRRCVVCSGVLDDDSVRADLASEADRREHEEIYGVPLKALERRGPSVVSLNGVLASLAVTEFMVGVTRLRPPVEHLTYKGAFGVVSVNLDPPQNDCFYCKGVRNDPSLTDISRWIQEGYGYRI